MTNNNKKSAGTRNPDAKTNSEVIMAEKTEKVKKNLCGCPGEHPEGSCNFCNFYDQALKPTPENLSNDLTNTLMSIALTPLLIYISPESHVFEYNRIMTNALDGAIKINLLSMTGCSNGIVTDFVGEDGRRYRNTLEVLDG